MRTILMIATLAMAASGLSQADTWRMRANMTKASSSTVRNIIAGWKMEPKKAANKMIAKYGQPHEATETRLIWWGNGPWKYTIIENIEIPHDFPMPHKDLMRQGIDYKVSPNRVDDLLTYDGSVIFDRTPGELSARCDKEEANFLAINLANDVATGRRTVRGARAFYSSAVKALMAKRPDSQQRRYTSGFVFRVPMSGTGFRDRPHGM